MGSIVIGTMMGGTVAIGIQCFETPESAPSAKLLAVVIAAILAYGTAIVMLSRQWSDEPNITKLTLLFALVQAGFLLTWEASRLVKGDIKSENPAILILVSAVTFQGLALLLVHFFLHQIRMGWIEGFGLNKNPGLTLIIGIAAGVLLVRPVLAINELLFHLFKWLTFDPQPQRAVEVLSQTTSLFERAASCISTVLLVPIGEEIIFRGILYPWAKKRFSQSAAMWGTAILFGAIHLNLSSFIPLTYMAVVLVLFYEFTGNLLAPIAIHVVFNGWNFIELFRK